MNNKTNPTAPQSTDVAFLQNEELVSLFEAADAELPAEAALPTLLRTFLSRAMGTVRARKSADTAGLRISEPVPIAELEEATGMLFPALLKREPFVFIDTETTGLDDDPTAKLVEIGMLRIADGMATEFNTLINPGIPIPPMAASVHHITDEMVAYAPSEDEVREAVIHFIGNATPVAHNAAFDSAFMNTLMQLPVSGEGARTNQWLCSLRMARHVLPDAERHNNQYLRYLFGTCPKDAGLGAHRAIDDVYVSVETLKVLFEKIEAMGFQSLQEVKLWCDQPVPYPRMTYGKYGPDTETGAEGRLLKDVPTDYFDWMQKNDKGYRKNWDQREAVNQELARRTAPGFAPHKAVATASAGVPLQAMNFGKHNARPIKDVDSDYLHWCCDNDGTKLRLTPEMRAGILADLGARKLATATTPEPDPVAPSRGPKP